VIPLAILFVIRLLDTKIRTKEDVENMALNIPVIAEIPIMKAGSPYEGGRLQPVRGIVPDPRIQY
jgi:hypothetical protein